MNKNARAEITGRAWFLFRIECLLTLFVESPTMFQADSPNRIPWPAVRRALLYFYEL
ncbi:MAG: hypothetical protein GYA34_17340 [Chloroflexi bacterium]|nr:hypothetical protein [Chloroflexota bacterium]